MDSNPQTNEYTVFELDGNSRNSIGSVTASSGDEAIKKAHQKYGAPIEVDAKPKPQSKTHQHP